jgi:hypothetical protein
LAIVSPESVGMLTSSNTTSGLSRKMAATDSLLFRRGRRSRVGVLLGQGQ